MPIHILTKQEFEDNSNKEVIREILLLEHETKHSYDELDALVRRYRYDRERIRREVPLYNIAQKLEENHGFTICPMVTL